MQHLISVLFGADYAQLRRGVSISDLVAEEALIRDNCAYMGTWWAEQFKSATTGVVRKGVPMGELLAHAADGRNTTPYMAEIIVSACHKIRQIV